MFAGPSTVLNAEFDRLTFATPEPQSWAMLLIGFASLGLLRLRPRRNCRAKYAGLKGGCFTASGARPR